MQTKRSAETHPAHLPREVSSHKVKHSVSAASIFKPRPRVAMKADSAENTGVKKHRDVKSRSSSHSPRKKRKSDLHPLALAFKETTDAYRTHLYTNTTRRISDTHDDLLTRLHNGNVQPVPDANHPGASPLQLTIAGKIDRDTKNIATQISKYKIHARRTNSHGELVPIVCTLGERMLEYEAHVQLQEQEMLKLQSQWESTVGDIWKLGIQVLGEGVMNTLLLPSPSESSASIADPKASSEDLPSVGDKPAKKTVTFKDPVSIPHFLAQPSVWRKNHIPSLPETPVDDVRVLEGRISELGTSQIEELKKLDEEQQKWWGRKAQQIAMAFKED